MWDELAAAAWIDPTLITKKETRYMSVDIDHGAAYGNTLTWVEKDNPKLGAQLVEIQMDLDLVWLRGASDLLSLDRRHPTTLPGPRRVSRRHGQSETRNSTWPVTWLHQAAVSRSRQASSWSQQRH
jgi:hypothetical protein